MHCTVRYCISFPYRRYEVVGTGYESSLNLVRSPPEEGSTADADSVGPDEEEDQEGLGGRDLGPGESLHDDIVAVVPDGDHGEDGADARDGARGPVQLTAKLTPHPVALGEGVDDDRPGLGQHHAEVRHRQVHHEHVGRGPQGLDLDRDLVGGQRRSSDLPSGRCR